MEVVLKLYCTWSHQIIFKNDGSLAPTPCILVITEMGFVLGIRTLKNNPQVILKYSKVWESWRYSMSVFKWFQLLSSIDNIFTDGAYYIFCTSLLQYL